MPASVHACTRLHRTHPTHPSNAPAGVEAFWASSENPRLQCRHQGEVGVGKEGVGGMQLTCCLGAAHQSKTALPRCARRPGMHCRSAVSADERAAHSAAAQMQRVRGDVHCRVRLESGAEQPPPRCAQDIQPARGPTTILRAARKDMAVQLPSQHGVAEDSGTACLPAASCPTDRRGRGPWRPQLPAGTIL